MFIETPNGSKIFEENTPEDRRQDPWYGHTSDCDNPEKYPGIERKGPPTSNYNCHSYAWHNQSPSNNKWIPGFIKPYWEDGSYEEFAYPVLGCVVTYGNLNNVQHSAIVDEITPEGKVIVRSKWGSSGVYRHRLSNCPYSTEEIRYFIRVK